VPTGLDRGTQGSLAEAGDHVAGPRHRRRRDRRVGSRRYGAGRYGAGFRIVTTSLPGYGGIEEVRSPAACDIADPAAVGGLVAAVKARFGRIDILVNDAAFNKAIPFADLDGLTEEVWAHIMAVNLTGPMRLTKAVAPLMKAQGRGRIAIIASVAGLQPTGSSIAYAVSKAGLIHLTRCMAVALAPETLVNCVAPGLLEGTRATANLRPEQVARSASSALLGRPADKDDCAAMVVAMCRTATMTGQTVVIDAGRVFH
jgi:3-oxoacyl-[acyl-carrier protein] reductase